MSDLTQTRNSSPMTLRFGFWTAIFTSSFSLIYVVGQAAEWLGLLGSGGGPENSSTALGLVILLVPSILLAPAFVLLLLCLHHTTAKEKQLWSHAALVFAIIYATLVSLNYFVQLTLVVPHLLNGNTQAVRPFLFIPFDSFIYSVDLLGYSFMSLATLFAAFSFSFRGKSRIVKAFLIANGLLLPFIALQNFYHPMIYIAALWAITFPGATFGLALHFKGGISSKTS